MNGLLNTILGLLFAGALGTKDGYGLGAAIFAWIILILLGVVGPLWLLWTLGWFGARVDGAPRVEKSLKRVDWSDTTKDKSGNIVPSYTRLGVLRETTNHHPDYYDDPHA